MRVVASPRGSRMGCTAGRTAKIAPSTTAVPIEELQGVHEIREDASATSATQLARENCEAHPRLLHYAVVFAVCAVPSGSAVLGLSLMGFGIEVYSAMAPHDMEKLGHLAAAFTAAHLVASFVFDVQRLRLCPRLMVGAVFFLFAEATALLKGLFSPWAAVWTTLMVTPAVLLEVRAHLCCDVKKTSFYKMLCRCSSMTMLLLLAAWLPWTFLSKYTSSGAMWTAETKSRLIRDTAGLYTHAYRKRALDWSRDCGPSREVPKDTTDAVDIAAACVRAQTVGLVILTVPFIVVLFDLLIVAFSFLRARLDLDDDKEFVDFLKELMILLVGVLMGVYVTLYAAGASTQLASAFMGFFAAAMSALVIYTFRELSPEVLQKASERSPLLKYLVKAFESDWIRAIGIGVVNLLLVAFLLLDVLRQQVRRWRGTATTTSRQTEVGRRCVKEMRAWNWCSILVKVNILGEIFACLIFGGKMTFVAFSYLNQILAHLQISILVTLLFVVGCTMFLLPPVPGSAVYIFYGIVIGKHAQTSIGFWPGVGVGSLVGLAAKLVASTGQYYIGYFLGKSVRVQRAVGVDTVPTRAIEQILKRRGFGFGKVAILVGGPDWPTSVTCGILQMSVPQMLLGTLPVYFASIAPQTLVGAMLTEDDLGNDTKMWVVIQTVATGFAAIAQAAASGVAAYAVTQTVERHHEELSQFREDHQKVAELTQREAAFVSSLRSVSSWSALSWRRRVVISAAAGAQLVVVASFVLDYVVLNPVFFRKFEMTGDINGPLEDGGLEGNVLNIVRVPFGVGSLALLFVGVCLHIYHNCDMRRAAKRHLAGS